MKHVSLRATAAAAAILIFIFAAVEQELPAPRSTAGAEDPLTEFAAEGQRS